jgi:hypothetical protein
MLFNTPSSSSSSSSSSSAATSRSLSKNNAKKTLEFGIENKLATMSFDSQESHSEQVANEEKATKSPSVSRTLHANNNELIDFEEHGDQAASSKSSLTDERHSPRSSKSSDHRITIDLTNDPDLLKYFQETSTNTSSLHSHNTEYSEEDRNKRAQVELLANSEAQIKLIDFYINESDSIEKPIERTSNTSTNNDQLINLSTINSISNNNDMKTKNLDDLFFDQLLSINKHQNVKPISDTKREESELDYFLTNKNNNDKQSDTLNPFSLFATNQKKEQSDSTSLRSIINEFDPFLSANSSTESKSNPIENRNTNSNKFITEPKPFAEFDLLNMMNKPAATATVTSTASSCLLNNNFANLTARPFQVPLNTNYYQQQQQQRSNNLFYSSSTNEVKTQSMSVNSSLNSSQRPILNPFAPTPYQSFNSSAMTNYYRPVHFQQQQQSANKLDAASNATSTPIESNKDLNLFE